MKKILFAFSFLTTSMLMGQDIEVDRVANPADWVNPLMGTDSKPSLSNGNTYPVIARPWGMNFWTPQTGPMGHGWVYTYDADKIRGFKQTHQPSPWMNDYGQFSIMPVTGSLKFKEDERASWFSHKAEVVKPYYYSVYLADHDVTAEFTTTERAAMFRFTFPKTDSAFVVLDAFDKGSAVTIDKLHHRITGYTTKNSGGVPDNFKNYFVIEFDAPFDAEWVFAKDELLRQNEIVSEHSGAVIKFNITNKQLVHARVASSFISPEQALVNLGELGNQTFDEVTEVSKAVWNKELSRIKVSGGTVNQTKTFYSCLYRTLLFPRKFYELTPGGIMHYSPYNGQVLSGYMFTDTGFWDTFRSLFPFINLMYPELSYEMQQGLANAYRESGWLPEWASPGLRNIMVGNNSASVVADAYLKNGALFDISYKEILYEAITHGANNAGPMTAVGRAGAAEYIKLGYVPYDIGINESAARTLEYAYDDFAIYQMAKALGKPKKEIDLYKKRSLNYKNLFDTETGLMRGKNKDGSFMSPFNPFKWGDAFT